jgi:hypothetical protein
VRQSVYAHECGILETFVGEQKRWCFKVEVVSPIGRGKPMQVKFLHGTCWSKCVLV